MFSHSNFSYSNSLNLCLLKLQSLKLISLKLLSRPSIKLLSLGLASLRRVRNLLRDWQIKMIKDDSSILKCYLDAGCSVRIPHYSWATPEDPPVNPLPLFSKCWLHMTRGSASPRRPQVDLSICLLVGLLIFLWLLSGSIDWSIGHCICCWSSPLMRTAFHWMFHCLV